jgi:hypothetical protein
MTDIMKTNKQQEIVDRLEKLSKKDEKELLARLIVEQGISNDLLDRTRKNTVTMVNIIVILLILEILVAIFL